MISFLPVLFFVAMTVDIIILFVVVNDRYGKNKLLNASFSFMCCGNILSNVGYAVLLMQEGNGNAAVISFDIAVAGILIFRIFSLCTFVFWLNIKNIYKSLFLILETIVCIIVTIIFVNAGNMEYIYTAAGGTFAVRIQRMEMLYFFFKLFLQVIFLAITVIIFLKSKNKRTKRLTVGMFGFDLALFFDVLFDLSSPGGELIYFPYNSLLYFGGILCLYITMIYSKESLITVRNMSEYIYYNVEAPILIFDENERLVIINRYGSEFFNMSEEECYDKTIADLFELDKNLLKTNKNNVIDSVCKKNNIICSLNINEILDKYNEVLGYMVFVNDQTEHVKAMKELEEARIAAEQGNKAKSTFLANMSHEIRTPINTIVGMNEMILRETKEQSLVKYASDIKSASNSLLAIINDILDFSKIESGNMELVDVDYDFASLLADEITVLSYRAKEKGLRFFFEVDPLVPKRLFGDDVRIRQIITNVLSNAIKYTDKGSVYFNVRIIEKKEDIAVVQVTVTDTGIGIKKEDIKKLFDAFSRVDMIKNRTIEGTGLGLNITMRLLEMMNGKMDVKSTYGKGSTFSCIYEQGIIDEDKIGDFDIYYEDYQSSSYTYHRLFEAPEASILLVDDNSMNISVIENLLKQTKINIVSVLSGKDAVRSAHDNKYDVIFMDHMMPNMDGIEALKLIRNDENGLSKDSPVIAMTANAVAGAKQMYISNGFNDYISKPVEPEALEKKLSEILPSEKINYKNTKTSDWIQEDKENENKLTDIENFLENNGINAISGLRNMNNNIENYQDMIKLFLKNINDKIFVLKALLDNNEDKNYGIEAHSLKSSAKLIGAEKLADICYKHEMAGRESKLDTARELWDKLTGETDYVMTVLTGYINHVEYEKEKKSYCNEAKKKIENEDLQNKFKEIREYTEDYDHIEAKKAIENLMDYSLDDDVLKKLKYIYKCLEEFDYDSAIDKVQQL